MALADMVIVIVEIADVVLKQMKDNVITATFKVVYMSSSFWLLAVESCDLSFCEFTQLSPTNQCDPTAN